MSRIHCPTTNAYFKEHTLTEEKIAVLHNEQHEKVLQVVGLSEPNR